VANDFTPCVTSDPATSVPLVEQTPTMDNQFWGASPSVASTPVLLLPPIHLLLTFADAILHFQAKLKEKEEPGEPSSQNFDANTSYILTTIYKI
jgi:hypothetical protein